MTDKIEIKGQVHVDTTEAAKRQSRLRINHQQIDFRVITFDPFKWPHRARSLLHREAD